MNLFQRPKTILITRENVKLRNFSFLWFCNGYNMMYRHVRGIRDALKQDLAFEFCRKNRKYISILTETHMNHNQTYVKNNLLSPIFWQGLLVLLYPGLEGIIEVYTDPKGRFVSSNGRVLCVYAASKYSTREQLARGGFFERVQNYMKNKNEGNDNKILLTYFHCTMGKIDT